ncbi:MAG: LysR family transcriptional regulator [Proteobacteria bacterium]|nr:LysR family transcriptional regulator [Pseudomonadota bacterium]
MDNPDKIDIHLLKIFMTVKETGSMTAAANLLGFSQSGVSQSIRTLEDALGVAVIDRTTRPLQPTPAGEILYGQAQRIMVELGRTFEMVRFEAMVSQPKLNFGIVDSFVGGAGPYLFANMGKIAERYRVWSGLGLDLQQNLAGRQIDILIATDGFDDATKEWVSHAIMTEPYILAIPSQWGPSGHDLQRLSEERRFIRYSLRSIMGKHIEQHLQRLKITPVIGFEFDASDSVLGMVGGGLGWAVTTPLCCLQARGRLNNVTLLPLPIPGIRRRIQLFIKDEQYSSIAKRVSHLCRIAVEKNCVPEIKAFAPWAAKQIIVHKGEQFSD